MLFLLRTLQLTRPRPALGGSYLISVTVLLALQISGSVAGVQ